MITEQEIREMPIDQKLRLMEAIWTEISRTSSDYASPDWHREELEETESRRALGIEEPMDWESAKEKLRNGEDEA